MNLLRGLKRERVLGSCEVELLMTGNRGPGHCMSHRLLLLLTNRVDASAPSFLPPSRGGCVVPCNMAHTRGKLNESMMHTRSMGLELMHGTDWRTCEPERLVRPTRAWFAAVTVFRQFLLMRTIDVIVACRANWCQAG